MNKDREIELFRKNKLSKYIKLAQTESVEKLKANFPQCWQCKQYKNPNDFYVLNKTAFVYTKNVPMRITQKQLKGVD